MRINKFLAKVGAGSRREIDQHIELGRILVNQRKAKLGQDLVAGDRVKFKSQEYIYEGEEKLEKNIQKFYFAFFKPQGLVCSNNSAQGATVFDFLEKDPKFPKEQKLHYIGRLDKDSRGLVIITNDGDFTYKTSHPKFKQEKEYIVSCEYPLNSKFADRFSAGLLINKEKNSEEKVVTKPCFCQQLTRNKFRTIIKQGYNRQIRKMVSKLGNNVEDLLRVRIGNIALKDYIDRSLFKQKDLENLIILPKLNEGELVEIKYFNT